MTKQLRILLFLGNDLRVSDAPVISTALDAGALLLPLAILDPRFIDLGTVLPGIRVPSPPKTFVGNFPKCGPFRTRFWLQSLEALSQSLQRKLLVLDGHPETIVPALIDFLNKEKGLVTLGVYTQKETASEESAIQKALGARLSAKNIPLNLSWNARTLYAPEDLPFRSDFSQLPDSFTAFRKVVEGRDIQVRERIPAPDQKFLEKQLLSGKALSGLSEALKDVSSMMSLLNVRNTPGSLYKLSMDLLPLSGLDSIVQPDSRGGISLQGGEKEALKRLNHYLWDTDAVKTYKETRNGLLGMEYSSKFSPFLALGCLSVRHIYFTLKEYEKQRGSNESTYWLYFELLWRDYWKFAGLKYGNGLFNRDGPKQLNHHNNNNQGKNKDRRWCTDKDKLKRWTQGQTGIPWVDAAMRELNATGFMSNRSRQNVASFLSLSLGLDWRLGAAYFESMLVDHDVHSNYGNWQYVSGVGTDPRDYRKFNMIKQQKDYDPSGEYVKTWVTELASLSPGHHGLFMPWEVKDQQGLMESGYPSPIVIEPEWSKFSSLTSGNSKSRRGNQRRGEGRGESQEQRNGFIPRTSDWKIVMTRRDPS